jgi:putative peptide zinc metalloprotease protein
VKDRWSVPSDDEPAASILGVDWIPVERAGRSRMVARRGPAGPRVLLGSREAAIAQLFDGRRSLGNIADEALERLELRITVEQLGAFEQRLLAAGILRGRRDAAAVDPYSGVPSSRLRRFIVLPLLRVNGDRWLSSLQSVAPWAFRRASAAVCCIYCLVTAALIPQRWVELGATFAGHSRWAWVASGIVFIALQALLHELGHGAACRAYGVPIREMGLALSLALPTGWTTPDQERYSALPRRARIAIILAGPLASLCWAATGWWIWRLAPAGVFGFAGASMLVSLLGTVPTLLPWFRGDAYLLVSEWLGVSSLRPRAFQALRRWLGGKQRGSSQLALLSFAVVTIVGWITTATLVLWGAAKLATDRGV